MFTPLYFSLTICISLFTYLRLCTRPGFDGVKIKFYYYSLFYYSLLRDGYRAIQIAIISIIIIIVINS